MTNTSIRNIEAPRGAVIYARVVLGLMKITTLAAAALIVGFAIVATN